MNTLRLAGRVAYQIGLFPARLRENIYADRDLDNEDPYSDIEYRDVLTWKEQLEIQAVLAKEQEDAAFVPTLPGSFVDDDSFETKPATDGHADANDNTLSCRSRKADNSLRHGRYVTRTTGRMQRKIIVVHCGHCWCQRQFDEDEGYDGDTETNEQ